MPLTNNQLQEGLEMPNPGIGLISVKLCNGDQFNWQHAVMEAKQSRRLYSLE